MATLAAEVATPIEQWLGPTLLAGTFALITALVGLGFNELQYRRQRRQRWEKDLRTLAARFLVAARAASSGDFSTISDAFYELELVAPQKVADAGTLLFTTAHVTGRHVATGRGVTGEVAKRFTDRQHAFTNSVRRELERRPLPPTANQSEANQEMSEAADLL